MIMGCDHGMCNVLSSSDSKSGQYTLYGSDYSGCVSVQYLIVGR